MKSILLCVLISFIITDTYYTVVSGDNLTKIANKFGTTVSKLVSWNNIADPNKIYVGQRLIVKKDSNPTPTPSPSQPSGSYKVTDAQMKKMGWTNLIVSTVAPLSHNSFKPLLYHQYPAEVHG